METEIVKLNCPSCGQAVELPEDDALRGVNCPGCNEVLRLRRPGASQPHPLPPPLPAPDRLAEEVSQVQRQLRAEIDLRHRREAVRKQAGIFTLLALIAAGVCLLAVVLCLANEQDDHWVRIFAAAAVDAASAALGLYIIAQIVHIRANTER